MLDSGDRSDIPVEWEGSETLSWYSTDEAVATVDAAGMVAGISDGRAEVVASVAGLADTVTVVVGPLRFDTVAGGEGHTCALMTHGVPFCWGSQWEGSLGDGVSGDNQLSAVPVPVSIHEEMTSISAGGGHTCAIDADGRLYCWGDNVFGSVGNGEFHQGVIARPERIARGHRFVQVDAGVQASCALTTEREVMCWGLNRSGAVGSGDGTLGEIFPEPIGVDVPGSIRSVTSGGLSCALSDDGRAFCWGENRYGEVGDGTLVARLSPVPAAADLRFLDLQAGDIHACGLTLDRSVYCWGDNFDGKLGRSPDSLALSPDPVKVNLSGNVAQLAVGGQHVCVLYESGETVCWGSDDMGELGDGDPFGRYSADPVQVNGNDEFTLLAPAGGNHSCALGASGDAYCWGNNLVGQLGIGVVDRLRVRPERVVRPD